MRHIILQGLYVIAFSMDLIARLLIKIQTSYRKYKVSPLSLSDIKFFICLYPQMTDKARKRIGLVNHQPQTKTH